MRCLVIAGEANYLLNVFFDYNTAGTIDSDKLFDESVDWKPVNVDGPVWPTSAFPFLAAVQTGGDIDVFPSRIETSFI